jgi:hypothetical protein
MLNDGTYDPRQVKLTGKSLVFTDDAWETCKVAIGQILLGDGTTTYGINAETIIGDLIIGNQLVIKDNDGNDLFTVIDNRIASEVSTISTRLDNMIVDEDYTYCVRPYGTSPSATDSDWSTLFPSEWQPGDRVWRKTVVTYDSGVTAVKAIEDSTGASGDDGISVVSVETEYLLSGSDRVITEMIYPGSSTMPGFSIYPSISEWSKTPPTYVPGHYYWERMITTYSDGNIVIGQPYVDSMLTEVWSVTTQNTTAIEQTDRQITLLAKSVTANANSIDNLRREITDVSELVLDDSHIEGVVTSKIAEYDINGLKTTVEEHTGKLRVLPDQIEESVTRTIQNELETDYQWAKRWLNSDGLHVATSSAPTETLIDGTGLVVREVDKNGNVVSETMKAKDGEVEAARFKANETFTYDSQRGYITTMKTYYSSADDEYGIGWYWRETGVSS